jgi:hypothetical protein
LELLVTPIYKPRAGLKESVDHSSVPTVIPIELTHEELLALLNEAEWGQSSVARRSARSKLRQALPRCPTCKSDDPRYWIPNDPYENEGKRSVSPWSGCGDEFHRQSQPAVDAAQEANHD